MLWQGHFLPIHTCMLCTMQAISYCFLVQTRCSCSHVRLRLLYAHVTSAQAHTCCNAGLLLRLLQTFCTQIQFCSLMQDHLQVQKTTCRGRQSEARACPDHLDTCAPTFMSSSAGCKFHYHVKAGSVAQHPVHKGELIVICPCACI